MPIFAQAATAVDGLAGSGWANASLGGVCVALLATLTYLINLWYQERKTYNKNQRIVTDQLVSVIKDNGIITSGNTQVIATIIKQTDGMADTVNDLRDKLMARPCLLQPDVTYRDKNGK